MTDTLFIDGVEQTTPTVPVAGIDSTAVHDNVAGEVNAVAVKATLEANDLVLIEDSGDSFNKKKATIGSLQVKNFKSYGFSSPLGATGDFYAAGYYEAPAADTTISEGGATQTLGDANVAHGAHVFIVASGAGSASGGAGEVEIEVSGTSITDAGVRNASATEVITADITTLTTDLYLETSLKWLGTVTFTIQPAGAGTHTVYEATFNYGLCKYEDWGNEDFTVTDFEMVGLAGANDTGFDITLLHHSSAGWTYSAAAFDPGGTAICNMNTDYSTEQNLAINDQFAYKRAALATAVLGSASCGVVAKITTGANGAIRNSSIHIGVAL